VSAQSYPARCSFCGYCSNEGGERFLIVNPASDQNFVVVCICEECVLTCRLLINQNDGFIDERSTLARVEPELMETP